MPTYDVKCSNALCNYSGQIHKRMLDQWPICPSCSQLLPRDWSAGVAGFICDGPSPQISKEKEDKRIGEQAKRARYLKASGQIPNDAVLRVGDVDVDKPLK